MCMIGFSEIVPDVNAQYMVGYFCSTIILLHLLVNMLIILIVTVKGILLKCKRHRYHKQLRKNMKVAQEERK